MVCFMQDSVDWASFNLLELLGGMEEKEEACCISLCWFLVRDLYLYNCRESGRASPGSSAAKGKGWRLLVQDGGRAFRLRIHCVF